MLVDQAVAAALQREGEHRNQRRARAQRNRRKGRGRRHRPSEEIDGDGCRAMHVLVDWKSGLLALIAAGLMFGLRRGLVETVGAMAVLGVLFRFFL